MSDALKQAESVGKVATKPAAYWHREADADAAYESLYMPMYVLQVTAKVTEVLIVLGDAYVGTATNATLTIFALRNGSPVGGSVDSVFQPGWASSKTVVTTLDWDLEPDDIIYASITKAGGGVILPSILLRITTEPS